MHINNSPETKKHYFDAIQFAKRYHPETAHLIFVSKLACKLFDELEPLHGQGDREREILEVAALLHDIGLSRGVKKHHKESMEIILNAGENLKLNYPDRQIIALVTRYHRRSIPKQTHLVYCDLDKRDREIVNILSSLIRIADALDRRHLQVIEISKACIHNSHVILYLTSNFDNCIDEIEGVNKKKDLFVQYFKKDLELRLEIGLPTFSKEERT